MISLQLAEHVVGADLSTFIYRVKQFRFQPKDSHYVRDLNVHRGEFSLDGRWYVRTNAIEESPLPHFKIDECPQTLVMILTGNLMLVNQVSDERWFKYSSTLLMSLFLFAIPA